MATPGNEAPEKCPCCDNPWSRAIAGTLFAEMCQACEEDTKKEKKTGGISESGMDKSMSPTENFYRYANGGWMDSNPIPSGYPSWNTFVHLHVLSQERLKDLLEDLSKASEEGKEETKKKEPSLDEIKVGRFYAAALDEDGVESAGLSPLEPVLQLVEQIVDARNDSSTTQLATLLGTLYKQYGISAFLSIGASPDYKNSQLTIGQLSQGGLGLPDRDYYMEEDEKKQEQRELYKIHVAKMLALLDQKDISLESSVEETKSLAQLVYDVELDLASSHMTKTDNRDPELTYNKMTVEHLVSHESLGNNLFDFAAFLESATGKSNPDLGEINIRNVEALQKVAQVISSISQESLRQYLRWHVVHSTASFLPKAFVQEHFDFFETTLTGTKEMKPRWKRAMAFTETALGEAMGQLYCAKYFDESCKEYALQIVENVRAALEERLKEVEWMASETTRAQALKKMSRFKVKIGYPDKWIDYTKLTLEPADAPLLTYEFQSRAFHIQRENDEMNAPTDTEKWFMTPQTINAYYHPMLNEIVFPAAILQPPFFNPDANDDALNYGAMGAVVGHEMTHGFDDKGRKFNFEGNMIDWWTKEDADEYERRVDVMVKQADAYQVHGKNVKGKLTCGENIADLGGLRLAYRALKTQHPDEDVLDGLTATQRFFVGWAQCWRQNITEERSLQLLTLDPHGPNEMRCNGPVS